MKYIFKVPGLRDMGWFGSWSNDLWNGIYMAENMRSVPGYFTDFQWFGRALSEKEIYDITTCRSFPKGKPELDMYKV